MEHKKAKFILIYPSRSGLASSRDEVLANMKAVYLFQVGYDRMTSNNILALLFFSVKLFDFEVIGEPV